MTEKEARKEIDKLSDEYIKRSDAILKKAKAEGKVFGLDGDKELFADLKKEIKARMKAVIDMIDE